MTSSFKCPAEFAPGADPASSWAEYKEGFEIYAVAAELGSKPISTQRATFLHILGPVGRRIYNTLPIVAQDDARTLPVILEAFDQYYQPYKNLTYLRYSFFQTKQTSGQTFNHFFTDLKTKAKLCEFDTLTNSLVTTQIVCGIRSDKLRKDLLAIPDLSIELAVQLCQADEISTLHSGEMLKSKPSTPAKTSINVVQGQRPNQFHYQRHQRSGNNYSRTSNQSTSFRQSNFPKRQPQRRFQLASEGSTCSSCGYPPHKSNPCPARFSICLKCRKKGHWALVCHSPNALQLRNVWKQK